MIGGTYHIEGLFFRPKLQGISQKKYEKKQKKVRKQLKQRSSVLGSRNNFIPIDIWNGYEEIHDGFCNGPIHWIPKSNSRRLRVFEQFLI